MTTPNLSWKNRADAKDKQEAVSALADFVSSSHGITLLMRKGNDPLARNSLLEVKAYAEKWEVPFSLQMLRETMSMMSNKRWNGEDNTPAPQRKDFKNNDEFYEAHDTWRYNINPHIWVSSSETADC